MRIIFLDIDGVLNKGSGDLLPDLVDNLNTLIDRTDANVVISSDWRKNYTLDNLRDLFRKAGYRYDLLSMTDDNFVYDYDDNFDMYLSDILARGTVIKNWIDANTVDKFVIIDDNPVGGGMDNYCVRTNPSVGLDDTTLNKAVICVTKT